MGRTKVLEFNLGDIVQMKKYGERVMLIVEKEEKRNRDYLDLYKYLYVGLDLLNGQEYGIYTNCNNKHYKIVG